MKKVYGISDKGVLLSDMFEERADVISSMRISYSKVGKITVDDDAIYCNGELVGNVVSFYLNDRAVHL